MKVVMTTWMGWIRIMLLVCMMMVVVVRGEEERMCFPKEFMVGTATAAYQVEGGWNSTGRTPSIWDTFCRSRENVECANVADDFYHRYPLDIQERMVGLSHFRFSFSWSRVMTWNATIQRMQPNPEGISFYKDLLQQLHTANIQPVVTMYHWDLPQALLDNVDGGWTSPNIVSHFEQYANLLYQEYGSMIQYWSTFNEPWTFTLLGYDIGVHAPGYYHQAYLAGHYVLLSHAAAVQAFRSSPYIDTNTHKISMVLNVDYGFPLNPQSPQDMELVERKMQFTLGWFLHPLLTGDYPAVMKEYIMPIVNFTKEQSQALKGSLDLFMLNHYSSTVITSCNGPNSTLASCNDLPAGWYRDLGVDMSRFPKGAKLSSTNAQGQRNCGWFSGVPSGYRQVIRWMHQQDTTKDIFLTENGWCGNTTIDNTDQLWYYQSYLKEVYQAWKVDNIPIIGYTAWSLLDNYEWGSFEPRFGLYYVQYPPQTGSKQGYTPKPTDLKRIPRPAAHYIHHVADTKCINTFPTKTTKTTIWNTKSRLIVVVISILAAIATVIYYHNYKKRTHTYAVITD